MYINVPAIILIDGSIYVDGADGTDIDGGGGSGGAVFIEAGKYLVGEHYVVRYLIIRPYLS